MPPQAQNIITITVIITIIVMSSSLSSSFISHKIKQEQQCGQWHQNFLKPETNTEGVE